MKCARVCGGRGNSVNFASLSSHAWSSSSLPSYQYPEASKSSQDCHSGFKSVSERSKSGPRAPQQRHKCAQESPRAVQEPPRSAQQGHKRAQARGLAASGAPVCYLRFSRTIFSTIRQPVCPYAIQAFRKSYLVYCATRPPISHV